MMALEYVFLLAVAAIGWGLSLASYRWIAIRNGWPMGEWHRRRPGFPIAVGLIAILFGLLVAITLGHTTAGWSIPIFGVLLAIFWTGFLRVGAQVALLLAPVATVLLLLLWVS